MCSPQFISNSKGKKVLTVLENELKGCDDLFISVAFITMGGIAPLLGTLKDLEESAEMLDVITSPKNYVKERISIKRMKSKRRKSGY